MFRVLLTQIDNEPKKGEPFKKGKDRAEREQRGRREKVR